MKYLKFQDGGVTNPLAKTPIQQATEGSSNMSDEEFYNLLDKYLYDPNYDDYKKEYERRANIDDKLSMADLGENTAQVGLTALKGTSSKIPYLGSALMGTQLGNDFKQAYLKYKMGEDFKPDMIEGFLDLLPFSTKIKERLKVNPKFFGELLDRLKSIKANYLSPIIQQSVHWSNDQEAPSEFKFGGVVFSKSGIKIKKKNEGKFTASAKAHGMGVQEYARKVLNDPNATPLQKRRANFARNASAWHRD